MRGVLNVYVIVPVALFCWVFIKYPKDSGMSFLKPSQVKRRRTLYPRLQEAQRTDSSEVVMVLAASKSGGYTSPEHLLNYFFPFTERDPEHWLCLHRGSSGSFVMITEALWCRISHLCPLLRQSVQNSILTKQLHSYGVSQSC